MAICHDSNTKVIQSVTTSKPPTWILWPTAKLTLITMVLGPEFRKTEGEGEARCHKLTQQIRDSMSEQQGPGIFTELPSIKRKWLLLLIHFTNLRYHLSFGPH